MSAPEDEPEIDVCQHCGGYFAWTPGQRAAAIRWGWKPDGREIIPQRCVRCLNDECWIERAKEG
jgi:hypothetical protein